MRVDKHKYVVYVISFVGAVTILISTIVDMLAHQAKVNKRVVKQLN